MVPVEWPYTQAARLDGILRRKRRRKAPMVSMVLDLRWDGVPRPVGVVVLDAERALADEEAG